jgi:hypothetical protein
MGTYINDFLEGINEHIRQTGDWTTFDTHYRYHIRGNVTPHSHITRVTENQDFWSSCAVKLSGSTAPTVDTDDTMNYPPPRMFINVQVSYSAITQKNCRPKTLTTASTAPTTTASTTSSISHTNNIEEND